ncbi:hypothetical protein Tco_1195737, partial [Tanacetum coccineum]
GVVKLLVEVFTRPKHQESVPRMVADAFEERILELLSDTLKNIIPQIIKDSVKQAFPKFEKRVKKTLKAQVADIILKPLNREFSALNKMESSRFVGLQKKLTKAIKTKVGKSVQRSVRKEIKVVHELLQYCIMQIDKGDVNIRKLVDQIRDLVVLIDTTSTSSKVAPEGQNMSTHENKDEEIIVHATAQGEQQPMNTTTEPETAKEAQADAQGEQSSEQAPPISTALVV